jgi:hypothetical protein
VCPSSETVQKPDLQDFKAHLHLKPAPWFSSFYTSHLTNFTAAGEFLAVESGLKQTGTVTMTVLAIAVSNSRKPYSYSKTSGPADATVSSTGDIDISNCAEADIDLQWTVSTGTFSTSGNAVTITGNGHNQVFGDPVLSENNTICSVNDSNPENTSNSRFNYTIHLRNSEDDPTIRNRS